MSASGRWLRRARWILLGLPEQPTTFGYSIDQLRRALWEDEQPFGLDIPEVHELRAYQAELVAAAEAEAP